MMTGFTLRATLDVGAARSPEAVALAFEETELTYAELGRRVDEVAAGLDRLGFGAGDALLAVLPNCVEYVELFYAVATLGGIIVPVNYLLSPEEVRHIKGDSGAGWIVVDGSMTGLLSGLDLSGTRVIQRGDDYQALRDSGVLAARPQVAPDDVVLLQYTSGTTGVAKAAVHTHHTLMWNTVQQVVDFGVDQRDSYLCVPALCWAAGFHDFTLAVLWTGGRVTLLPSRSFDPARFRDLLVRHRVSIVVLVPSVLRILLRSGLVSAATWGSIRLLASGGEALPVELIEEFEAALPSVWVMQCYGMTEGPMIMTYLDRDSAVRKRGSAGKAMSMTVIEIRRSDGTAADSGEVGEIVVRSPASMIGYHRAPEQTALALRDGWLHTGDNGWLDEEGYLYVAGRAKDMMISGGLNVYPAEIERVLLRHPAVREVAVVGVPHEVYGEVGRAHVVVAPDAGVTPPELARHARQSLAGYKVPRVWVLGAEPLPRTTSGKVLKSKLRELPKGTSDVEL
ncbi:long-chain fatty acid--CoA ligase [Acrocarpospora macrocephala]